jgi:hypothetical protein
MKIFTLLIVSASALGVLSTYGADERSTAQERRERAERRQTQGDVEKLLREINALDNKPGAMRAGMAAVSKETAVPLPTIEAEHTSNPNVGLAGLFVAHELSVQTHKPVDQFLKQHRTGKTWTEIARANGENLNTMQGKLERIRQAMLNPDAAAAASSSSDATRVRAAAYQTEFDRRVQMLNTRNDQPAAMRAGLAALSKETAVPLPTVEENQKQHPDAGLGDLFVAQELSTKTQKSVDELLRVHATGKTWSDIAKENNQDVASIQTKLANLEQAMRDTGK